MPADTILTQTLIHDFDTVRSLNPGAEAVDVHAVADARRTPQRHGVPGRSRPDRRDRTQRPDAARRCVRRRAGHLRGGRPRRSAGCGGREDARAGEGNLVRLVERALPVVGEIQVADVPGRCEPGTGEISYPMIAATLDRLGYAGVVGLEGWASGDPVEALERFRTAFTVG